MTKVGFIKELSSGDLIILPDGGAERLRLTNQAMPGRFAGAAGPAAKSDKLLRALVALRKQIRKN
jgi:hypothetical protein